MNAKKFAADAGAERKAIEALIEEAIPAGFLNIDIDTSTLVDMSQPTEALQQRQNYENALHFTRVIRALEPKEVTISIGEEIGELSRNFTARDSASSSCWASMTSRSSARSCAMAGNCPPWRVA